MKKHEINVKDLIEWKVDAKVLFASSTNGNKALYATLNGNFIVTVKGETIFESIQPFDAVEKYNSL